MFPCFYRLSLHTVDVATHLQLIVIAIVAVVVVAVVVCLGDLIIAVGIFCFCISDVILLPCLI